MIIELYYNNRSNTKKYCRKYPSAYLFNDGLYLYSGALLGFSFGFNIKTETKRHIIRKANKGIYKYD